MAKATHAFLVGEGFCSPALHKIAARTMTSDSVASSDPFPDVHVFPCRGLDPVFLSRVTGFYGDYGGRAECASGLDNIALKSTLFSNPL